MKTLGVVAFASDILRGTVLVVDVDGTDGKQSVVEWLNLCSGNWVRRQTCRFSHTVSKP